MFDISWSELLILAVVTLIFVGPKELPRFLGTLGRYAGVVRRHANEFRRVFEEAMREAELDEIRKSVDSVRTDMASSIQDVERQAKTGLDSATAKPSGPVPAQQPDTPPAAVTPAAQPVEASTTSETAKGDVTGKAEGPH